MVYLIKSNIKLSAQGPSSSCEETQKPTICSCVVLPFLYLFNNSHSWHHWALSQCPALCCLLSVSSEPSFRAVLFPECTLPPAGEVPLLWEKALKPFHKEGGYTTRNSGWASVFTGLSRRENPVIRPEELNEQFLRTSTCQLAAIFSEGPYPQGACREREEKKKKIYIYIYMCVCVCVCVCISFYSMKVHI